MWLAEGTIWVIVEEFFQCSEESSTRCIFRLLEYQKEVSRSSVGSTIDLSERNERLPQALEKLLKTIKGSEELEISCWRRCADESFLLFKDG